MNVPLRALTLALTLAAPAAAQTDAAFNMSLSDPGESILGRMRALKNAPSYRMATQESGPNDPILLAQKPLLDMIKKLFVIINATTT